MTGKAAPLQQLAPEGPQRAVNGRIHGAGFGRWHLDQDGTWTAVGKAVKLQSLWTFCIKMYQSMSS